jgi:hypothetical protein
MIVTMTYLSSSRSGAGRAARPGSPCTSWWLACCMGDSLGLEQSHLAQSWHKALSKLFPPEAQEQSLDFLSKKPEMHTQGFHFLPEKPLWLCFLFCVTKIVTPSPHYCRSQQRQENRLGEAGDPHQEGGQRGPRCPEPQGSQKAACVLSEEPRV